MMRLRSVAALAVGAAVLFASGCGSTSSQATVSGVSYGSEASTESETADSGSTGGSAASLNSGSASEASEGTSLESADDSSTDSKQDVSETADSELSEEEIPEHVTGIKDFSIIAGQKPDVMAGISWDDKIGTVVCDSTQVDWDTDGKQDLTYVIAAIDKTIARETITVTVLPDLDYHISGMEGTALVVEGSEFDAMDGVTWDDTIESVTADTSQLDTSKKGEYPVSYTLTSKDGQTQVTTRRITVVSSDADAWANDDSADNYSVVIDLGLWRLTAYMDTPADQGPYVGKTASGAPLVAGETVAVSAATCERLGLKFGDKLLIDGHVYTLEDHGGSAMNDQLWVDIFVSNEADEYSDRFNRYSEVYLLR